MAVARRGLARGRQSHAFTEEQFLRALDAAAQAPQIPRTVYAELDGAGLVVLAGAGGAPGAGGSTPGAGGSTPGAGGSTPGAGGSTPGAGGSTPGAGGSTPGAGGSTPGAGGSTPGAGAALLAAGARPAPHPAACNVELVLHAPQPPPADHTERGWARGEARWLALRVRSALAPHDELRVWPAAPLAPPPPPLQLRQILGNQYECDTCNAQFDDHRSWKEHSAASCGGPEPRAFWRRVLRAEAPPAVSMEALEALATAWGRARGAHACVYCGKLYSRRYGLKIHIRTHTGYKPLRCRHCARAFGDPSNLNKHVRLHAAGGAGAGAGGRHACARCPAVLARRRDLQRHLRAHDSRPPRA